MQDKYAIMIDAGYLFAEGSKLMFGSVVNSHISGDRLKLNLKNRINSFFEDELDEEVPRFLRMYWYDAKDRSDWIAQRPGVTLRLGRVNQKGTQKGVDGAIIRDMLTLARNRAVTDIFLMSGDEDLIEGVTGIKDLGIRVNFLRLKTDVNNMSNLLLREADGLIELNQNDLIDVLISEAEIVEPKKTDTNLLSETLLEDFKFIYLQITERFSVQELMAMRPRIPQVIDKMIFQQAADTSMPTEVDESERRRIRGAFWQFIAMMDSGTQTE